MSQLLRKIPPTQQFNLTTHSKSSQAHFPPNLTACSQLHIQHQLRLDAAYFLALSQLNEAYDQNGYQFAILEVELTLSAT